MNKVVILGSSRSNGNTAMLARQFAQHANAEVVDLADYNILPYDYDYQNQHDDFAKLIERLLTFEHLIFASPIYWYAPSGVMKIFLDRICDLLELNKHTGRQLREKSTAVLSTGAANDAAACFEQIFSKTFDYLGMHYKGMLYCDCKEQFNALDHKERLNLFVEKHYAKSVLQDISTA